MATWEDSLLKLGVLNVSTTGIEVCCSCFKEQGRYKSNPSINVKLMTAPKPCHMLNNIEYCTSDVCECGERSIIKLTGVDSSKNLLIYTDQMCADGFDVNDLKSIEVISTD
eukprot:320501_1